MQKICFIQKILKDDNFLTESEQINFKILKALTALPFDIEVICSENNMKKKYGIKKIIQIPIKHFDKNVKNIIHSNNYDFSFSTDYINADIIYLTKHTTKYIENVVKSPFEKYINLIFNYPHILKRISKEKNILNNAKIIFTPSSILKNDIINTYHIDGQKIFILPPDCISQKRINKNQNDIFTFGFTGNSFYEQGGLLLLKAASYIAEDFKIKIFNNNEQTNNSIKKEIHHYHLENKVELITDDISYDDFIKNIDALILTSKNEPFGLSALEAMSRGKIVLVSSRCGIKDIIEHDNNGYIFDITKNPEKNLSRAIRYILSNSDDFENMMQKALFTASVYNSEKLNDELYRIINSNFSKQDIE